MLLSQWPMIKMQCFIIPLVWLVGRKIASVLFRLQCSRQEHDVLLSDITKLGASGLEVLKLLELMEENAGRPMFFSIEPPYAYWPGIGFAPGPHQRAGFVLHNNIAMDVDLGGELLAPISYARNFFEDRLSVAGL